MRRLVLAPVLVVLATPLAACDRQPTTRVDGRTVTVEARDFRFEPQHLSMLAGQVTLTLRNTGEVPHNLQVRRNERRVLLRIPTVLPGQTGTATARLRSGRYEIVSTVARDEQLGQHGTLEIR